MKIGLYQGHFPVGKVTENQQTIMRAAQDAKAQGIGLLFFPELALSGYSPEDLLWQPDFRQSLDAAFQSLQSNLPEGIVIGLGLPIYRDQHIYNSLVVFDKHKIWLEYHKQCLPNYGVFDEARYFTAGNEPGVFTWQNQRIGVLICEDVWNTAPLLQLQNQNLDLLVAINASPFAESKRNARAKVAAKAVELVSAPLLYVHQIGVQDEVIYDGASFYYDKTGTQWELPQFEEVLAALPLDPRFRKASDSVLAPKIEVYAEVYHALCFALKGYVEHNRFSGVLLGLSGGIDSALTLAIAVDALGKDRVEAVLMPSRFSADISFEDAETEAKALGVTYQIIPIESLFHTFVNEVSPHFSKPTWDVTEENIQARLRGMILMALSNKSGKMVVTTTNKSEAAVGYGTLYGDMAGGFSLLKDVYKTEVYQLARYRNTKGLVIPERVLTRAPSAELREDQTDQDSLPDYAILDAILKAYIEQNQSLATIKAQWQGTQDEAVDQVVALIRRNEYKRKQAALGPKVTTRAFGKEWRMPVMS